MAGTATIHGGVATAASVTLTPAQQTAATAALNKLSSTTTSTTAVTGAATKLSPMSATTTNLTTLKTATTSNGLLTGAGNDTFAGGVSTAGQRLSGFTSDTVGGGTTGAPAGSSPTAGGGFALSSDTVSSAGATAAGVKALDPSATASAAHTIVLPDKTTINIAGVSPHNLGKPSGH